MAIKPTHSVRGRLTGIIMLISTIVALLASFGFIASGLYNLHERMTADLITVSRMISSHSLQALVSGDRQEAAAILRTLSSKPSMVAAVIYTKEGMVFAQYHAAGSPGIASIPKGDGFHIGPNRYCLGSPIVLNHQRVGTLYVVCDMRDRNSRLKQYGEIAAGILLISLLTAYVLAARLQRRISRPIVELARVAALVSEEKTLAFAPATRNSRTATRSAISSPVSTACWPTSSNATTSSSSIKRSSKPPSRSAPRS
jgi:uncharacterized membrane protein affecting hemolysin expression